MKEQARISEISYERSNAPSKKGSGGRQKAMFYKLDYIYRWKPLMESSATDQSGDEGFREIEKLLYKSGLHSKLVRENDKLILYVRESEYECANALAHGEVSAVYGKTTPEYILFKDDFDYRNEKFHQDHTNSRRMRINARLSMFYMAIVIIVSMFIIYYTTR